MDSELSSQQPTDFRPVLVPDEDVAFVGSLATVMALTGALVVHARSIEPQTELVITALPVRFTSLVSAPETELDAPEDVPANTLLEALKLEEPIPPSWTGSRAVGMAPGSLGPTFALPTKMDEEMATVDFPYTQSFVLYIDGKSDTEVRYRGFSKARAEETIRTFQNASSWLLGSWGEEYGLSGRCRKRHLTIYDLTDEQINDRALMSFGRWDSWDFKRISGMYDTSVNTPNHGSMFITASLMDDAKGDPAHTRARVIAHETAHYWQDRSCRMSPVKPAEKLARKFERAFRP